MITETTLTPPEQNPSLSASMESFSDRRSDVDAKMGVVGELLRDVGCDGLLLLEPENFAWLSSGGTARGVLDPAQMPAVYGNGDQRWALCSNVDAQRLFDEELDGLGFQLKEWPWHWGREQLLADLCQNRKVGCDRVLEGCVEVAGHLRKLRRKLTEYEQACFRVLGGLVSHAVEATCRTIEHGSTEREIAAHVHHRLVHRGVQPISISVAVDGRSRHFRQPGYTSAVMKHFAVIIATGRKYGLNVTASRTVSFGAPETALRKEHDSASKVTATYVASTWPDAVTRDVLTTGRRVYQLTGFEHEWLLAPQGHLTGRLPVELLLTPSRSDLFQAGWAVTWQATAGAAHSCDTFLVQDKGPELVTPTETWPLKRIRVSGGEFVRPDILQR